MSEDDNTALITLWTYRSCGAIAGIMLSVKVLELEGRPGDPLDTVCKRPMNESQAGSIGGQYHRDPKDRYHLIAGCMYSVHGCVGCQINNPNSPEERARMEP